MYAHQERSEESSLYHRRPHARCFTDGEVEFKHRRNFDSGFGLSALPSSPPPLTLAPSPFRLRWTCTKLAPAVYHPREVQHHTAAPTSNNEVVQSPFQILFLHQKRWGRQHWRSHSFNSALETLQSCPRRMVAVALTSFALSVAGANFVMALNAMAERKANFSLAYLES